MKHFLKYSVLMAVALAFAPPALQAASYDSTTILPANAATVNATTGTNIARVIRVTKQDTVAVQIEAMASAAGAYTFTIPFQYSVDGAEYAGLAPYSVSLSLNGVTKQTIVTNIPTYGAGFLRIPHVTNHTATINVTNLVIKAAIKVP